jgi:polar amino acid transport system substrate-binding protein
MYRWIKVSGWMGIVVIALTFALADMVKADTSLSKVNERGELVVGFCAQYPPFESKNEKTGEFEGFDVDLARALAKEVGVKVRLVDAEWQGLLAGLKKGDYDTLITCMSKSEARGENTNFSDVYYTLPDVIVVRKDENTIIGKETLRGKTVGVQLGSGSEQLADSMKEMFKEIKKYNYNPEAFTDLKVGRIDAVLVGYAYAVNQMKTDPSYKVVGEPLAEAEIVAVLPKGADALTTKINEALAKIKADGTYQAILDKWLKVD